MSIAFSLHLLAAALWVGGMFFAYIALRPVAASLLEPPIRLELWHQVFKRFFVWVWAFVLILGLSGYYLIFFRFLGFANVGPSVHIMQLTGWCMFLVYSYLYFSPYKKFKIYLSETKLPQAAECLNVIRKGIAINLSLGLITLFIASTHRF